MGVLKIRISETKPNPNTISNPNPNPSYPVNFLNFYNLRNEAVFLLKLI